MEETQIIDSLAKELNESTEEWLESWTNATGPQATEADIIKFMSLAGRKRDTAQKLVKELYNAMLDKAKG